MKNTWPEKVHTLRFIAKYSFSRDRVFTTLLELYPYANTHPCTCFLYLLKNEKVDFKRTKSERVTGCIILFKL